MAFTITARTILQLGAELISSDAVALYELIKNAIDARSQNGVEIRFQIILLPSNYDELTRLLEYGERSLEECKKEVLSRLEKNAEDHATEKFETLINNAKSGVDLQQRLDRGYRELNHIEICDTGHGMSKKDLQEIYLTIGTANRAKHISEQARTESGQKEPVAYLGEKGVGRLSAMRLGFRLHIETAIATDASLNILDINWREFEEAFDKPFDVVHLEPKQGPPKPPEFISGTKILISDLCSTWTREILEGTIRDQLTRLTDPFSFGQRRRFPIRIYHNGTRVDYVTKIRDGLLQSAHAVCKGKYEISNHKARLKLTITANMFGGAKYSDTFDDMDLKGITEIESLGMPRSALQSVGPFDFELYWFNRQRLKAIPDIGDRETIRKLIRQWIGIMLFRDGYRVLPYGDEGDDWLGLDREALSSGGYKLNTKQLIGRVRIRRLANPKLIDQTNREGIQDCPEKHVLIETLRNMISRKMAEFLKECEVARKKEHAAQFEAGEMDERVEALEVRTKNALRMIRRAYTGENKILQQVNEAFVEITDIYSSATARLAVVEDERERMTHLAGIGLMVEVVAHELTRATEYTLTTLRELRRKEKETDLESVLSTLESQLSTIQKRLRILEPLSIPARQRRSRKDLGAILRYIIASHEAQFIRHGIVARIRYTKGEKTDVQAFVVEGMIVQILENLVSNSVFWLNLYRKDHSSHSSEITIILTDDPPSITYFDNGPGIPEVRRDIVFEPFFSTKGTTQRHGLGLYIARQNAELMEGSLRLIEEPSFHEGRLNAFLLELSEGPK